MKIDTLSFLNVLLISHQPSVFHPHIDVLVPVSTVRARVCVCVCVCVCRTLCQCVWSCDSGCLEI